MMRRRRLTLGLATLAALLIVLVFFFRERRSTVSGPLPHEAYLWQRAWTPGVVAAAAHPDPPVNALVVLGAEINWRDGRGDVVRVEVDYAALRRAKVPIGIALRVGAYSGPFTSDAPATAIVVDTAAALVQSARTAELPLRELQIDFDCATSRLAGYRAWVQAIKQRVAPLPVTITALPSWLDRGEFASLARATEGYVLQVHSLERPSDPDGPITLCDVSAARRAVDHAATFQVPFRVALPTYGYLVAFDRTGKFIGLGAEGPARSWPADARLRDVHADPTAMASLVREWTAERPAQLTGIIWYRLPCEGDAMNWRPKTLSAVMAGREPRPDLRATLTRTEPGLTDVQLVNEGNADAPLKVEVRLRWQVANVLGSDALGGFESDFPNFQPSQREVIFRTSQSIAAERLAPGETRAVGWLRLSEDREVQADVHPTTP